MPRGYEDSAQAGRDLTVPHGIRAISRASALKEPLGDAPALRICMGEAKKLEGCAKSLGDAARRQ
jgi:hypothetical protein